MTPLASGLQAGDCPQVRQVEPVGVLEGPLELTRSHYFGQVQQGPRHAGDGNSLAHGAILVVQVPRSVQCDSGPSAAGPDHFDPRGAVPSQAPERRGASVAQDRVVSTGKHGRHPVAAPGQDTVADCVNAGVDPVQPPRGEPVLDGPRTHSERDQLATSQDSVLPSRELCDELLTWST
jgi:hypothetical protein